MGGSNCSVGEEGRNKVNMKDIVNGGSVSADRHCATPADTDVTNGGTESQADEWVDDNAQSAEASTWNDGHEKSVASTSQLDGNTLVTASSSWDDSSTQHA